MSLESMPIPFRFVDLHDQKQHILLLYEDAEYARLIEFRFIKNGLVSGENCLYVTDEDSGSIVLKLLNYGIPFRYFQTRQLRVIQMHEVCGSKDQISAKCKQDMESILGQVSCFHGNCKVILILKTNLASYQLYDFKILICLIFMRIKYLQNYKNCKKIVP
ncbi:MAG TPA: MEDS domain-containing protein [Nitrosopumilaceae archaeon]|nr:MEDS domain-containing protein [Nitrosopumilaceae archaeon]